MRFGHLCYFVYVRRNLRDQFLKSKSTKIEIFKSVKDQFGAIRRLVKCEFSQMIIDRRVSKSYKTFY